MIMKIGRKEWAITVNGEEVEYLFNHSGIETFNPTAVFEYVE